MSPRERVLVWTVGPIVACIGGGLLLYFCLIRPIVDGEARVIAAMAEKDEADKKLAEENRFEKRVTDQDPHLLVWQRESFPESPDKATLAHNTRMQDEYQRIVSQLFKDAGLNMTVLPRLGEPETKTAPLLPNKVPLYTRFIFNFEAEGSYESIVKMLEHLERLPLLHKVSKLELSKMAPTGNGPGPGRGAGGGAIAGFGQGGGAIPGFGQGGGAIPGFGQGGGAIPGAGPGAGPGGAPGRTGRGASMLKLALTLELLQVNGAEKRYTLLPYSLGYSMAFGPAQAALYTPPTVGHPPRVLAYPERTYTDMVAKNIFFGQTLLSERLTSDHFEAIRFNKLVCVQRAVTDFEVRLMPDLKSRDPIPSNADRKKFRNLVVVASVNDKLYLRIFDGKGEILFDDSETRLPNKKLFDTLRIQMDGLWPPHQLSLADKDRIISTALGPVPFKAMLYDQRKPPPSEEESSKVLERREDQRYLYLVPGQDFDILDNYNNTVMTLHVIEVTEEGVFFQVVNPSTAVRGIRDTQALPQNKNLRGEPLLSTNADQVYRLKVGDFLTDGLGTRVPYPSTGTKETEKVGKAEKIDKEKTADKR